MALRWTCAGMMEVAKGFRRLKPTSSCPFSELRLQLISPSTSPNELNTTLMPHSIIPGDACFAYFNKIWGILLAAFAAGLLSAAASDSNISAAVSSVVGRMALA